MYIYVYDILGCDLSGTSGSPSDKILACSNVPAGATVSCYMKSFLGGPNVEFKGNNTILAVAANYPPSSMVFGAYANVNLVSGTYTITTTGVDQDFEDMGLLNLQTEYNAFETITIFMQGTVALTVSIDISIF